MSERATGRRAALVGHALGELHGHAALATVLADGTDDDPTEVIVPSQTALRWYDEERPDDPPDVAIIVALVTGASTRINHRADKTFTLDCILQFRRGVADVVPPRWPHDVLDEVDAVMDAHYENTWIALGRSGGTDEAAWNDAIGRFEAVGSYRYRRRD